MLRNIAGIIQLELPIIQSSFVKILLKMTIPTSGKGELEQFSQTRCQY